MQINQYETSVLLIIFNRPDTTSKVFEAIRKAKPAKLYVAADGPRSDAEKILTDAARLATELIDWPCEVQRNYADHNMGCKMRPFTAISWAFEQSEELIILEDDCLPHPDFFRFCIEMLNKYRFDDAIMHISGNCFLPFELKESYYFTRYTHVWGWATWRKAWEKVDIKMEDWDILKSNFFPYVYLQHQRAGKYWTDCFDYVADPTSTIWDYQWTYSVWKNGGIAIAPAVNLVSNIGFGQNATHTKANDNPLHNIQTHDLGDIVFPSEIKIDKRADGWVRDNVYLGPKATIFKRFFIKLRRILIQNEL